MNGNKAFVTIGWLVLISFSGAVAWVTWPADLVTQPVQYPHAQHLALGMECASCHTGAKEGTHAGIPSSKVCALCHIAGRTYPKTPDEMAKFLSAGTEIPWRQVHRVSRHVLFSHRRHTTIAGLDCSECHGDVKSMKEPFTHPYFINGFEGMKKCVACHESKGVTSDCNACHR